MRIILSGCLEIALLKTAVMLSMDSVTVFLYGVFPYIALVLFVVGVLYRLWSWFSAGGLTGLYSVAVMGYSWGVRQEARRGAEEDLPPIHAHNVG